MSARRRSAIPLASKAGQEDRASNDVGGMDAMFAALPHTHLPSVYDLGLAYAAAAKESLDATEIGNRTAAQQNQAHWTENTFGPRADALRTLIATLPAQTLADVAVHLGIVASLATELSDGSDGSDDGNRRCAELGLAIERIALSGVAVIAREAGMDLDALDLGDTPRMLTSRFAGTRDVA